MRAASLLLLALALLLPGCVQPWDALGGDADAGADAGTAGAADLDAPPTFAVRYVGRDFAEPTVGVTSTGAIFVASGDFVMRSRDDGLTWQAVHELGPPVAGQDLVFTYDPMLWVDRDTDRIFVPHMWPVYGCLAAHSDDEGESWVQKPPFTCGIPGVDHQKLATGPYAEGTPQPLDAVYPNVVYYCYNKGYTTQCAVSFDGGLTFPLDRTVEPSTTAGGCGGVNGHPAAAPDGTVYVPFGSLGGGLPLSPGCGLVSIAVSFDNGLTWETRYPDVSDLGQAELDPDITVTPDGTAYLFFRAAKDHKMYLLRSTDAFATVDGPFLVSPPEVTIGRFTAITSGDDGRIALAYLGTRDAAERPQTAPETTRWNLYAALSFDADSASPTFTTVQVTPDSDPVQIGPIWEGGGGDPSRNLLDFIDLHIGPEGRPVIAFADGCVGACASNPDATAEDSRGAATAIAILSSAPSIHASYGFLRE